MDRNLALEFVRVTEAAAIAASAWIGRGDKNGADGAAVAEMRARFNQIDFAGKIVIGEGEKDEAPMLYTGELVGLANLKKNQAHPNHFHNVANGSGDKTGRRGVASWDLAVDPLECTDSVAYGRPNAMAVIASGARGSLLHAPDTYMDKLAVGKAAVKVIDLDAPVKTNLQKIAKALGKDIREVTVMLLDRERNMDIVRQIRLAGSRVRLVSDGDVAAAVASCLPENPVDALFGSGGSTEAVLAAVAVKILGGEILCRFLPRSEKDAANIKKMGIRNLKKIYSSDDLAKGSVLTFTATGIIDGPMLSGVVFEKDRIVTHSVVMRKKSGTARFITAFHHQK